MRWLAAVLLLLIVALQVPLWFGKGGWLVVRELDRQLAAQQEANARLKARNDTLDADVRDLKTGSAAIEERARAELGMIKHDEVMFQLQGSVPAANAAPGGSTPPAAGVPSQRAAPTTPRPPAKGASAASTAAPTAVPAAKDRP